MMTVCVVQLARFIIRTILAVALTFACLNSGIAQAQELTPHEPSAAENDSAAEASKQAANPLANAWLMQVQQNTNWIGVSVNNGNRVQSNLQFQPLMSVKLR
jgi:ABC-type phosphate transport system substrate-binding protein